MSLAFLYESCQQIGWKVYLYPHVSEKALIDAVKRLLPEGVSITGNASVYQHLKTVSVSCTGEMSAKAKEEYSVG